MNGSREPTNLLNSNMYIFLFRNKAWVILGTAMLTAICLFVVQAFVVPHWWGDDYFFALKAKGANLDSASWLAPFYLGSEHSPGWRPFGLDTWWRFLDSVFSADVVFSNLLNVLLHVVASITVGWFVAGLVKHFNIQTSHVFAGALAGFLYSIHPAHFLSVTWVGAANNLLCVIFSALTLGLWLKSHNQQVSKYFLCMAGASLTFVLALFSRESAIVLPALGGLLILLVRPQDVFSRNTLIFAGTCTVIVIAWFILFSRISNPVPDAYDIRIDSNVLRNTASLLLFFLGTPREAMRFMLTEPSASVALWGSFCFLSQLTAFMLFIRSTWNSLHKLQLCVLLGLAIAGSAPYFFFAHNSYAYYTAISLFAYAIVVGLGSQAGHKVVVSAAVLAVASSLASWSGNYMLDYPSLLGRAFWAERQLTRLEQFCIDRADVCDKEMYLRIENSHKFHAIGEAGLEYRLGIPQSRLQILTHNDNTPTDAPILVFPDDGDAYIEIATNDGRSIRLF